MMSVFRSAILDSDGRTVNVGYLSLFWIMWVVLTVIPLMCLAAGYAIYVDASTTQAILLALGQGVGLVTTAFAAALGALGLFIYGDTRNSRSALPPVQTFSDRSSDSTTL